MKTEDYDILDLIPQRLPIVMVDKLIYNDELKAITKFFIHEDNIFCENGFLCEPGLIENIAQTAAAKLGYENKLGKKKVLIGYIASIRNLKIYFLPKTQTTITTEINIENEIMGFTLIHGQNMSEGKICAECEMRLFSKQES